MSDLERVRARVEAASSGAWQRHGSDVWLEGSSVPLFEGRDGTAEIRRQADADAEFVAHARQDVLDLLAAMAVVHPSPADHQSASDDSAIARAPGPFTA